MSEQDITRRTVAKGLAWSMPILLVSAAAPLAAASTVPEACLRFIGTPPKIKKDESIKMKVQNKCKFTARNVILTISYTSNGTPINKSIALGDIAPNGHAPTEHDHEFNIPADVETVLITATADNAEAYVEAIRR